MSDSEIESYRQMDGQTKDTETDRQTKRHKIVRQTNREKIERQTLIYLPF